MTEGGRTRHHAQQLRPNIDVHALHHTCQTYASTQGPRPRERERKRELYIHQGKELHARYLCSLAEFHVENAFDEHIKEDAT